MSESLGEEAVRRVLEDTLSTDSVKRIITAMERVR